MAYDHVLSANTASRSGLVGPPHHREHVPGALALVSYLAGLTSTIELVTAVIILPQRQTTLAAKQTACEDAISRARDTLAKAFA